ncbi:DUF488 domain-containing protein [Lactobacillus sp. CBA3606]|uniref:DUF488 domain-containing protein n=1 Tax=Lactobacillus sp. CBA3606 TaxID=2099789 RepID=UPI000CFDCFE1|nr:DUF488 family protein [Lactobacillus sp. CBA3606]AVK63916.1 DUF488 domain-containing protein [Lactobacillus sp. CBA3606]
MKLRVERIYTKPVDLDGYRILVDRLWPRGISKVNAQLDDWVKTIAPSTELRQWFNHEPEKYPVFKKRYLSELENNPLSSDFCQLVNHELKKNNVILLYGAKDEHYNQAIVLRTYLMQQSDCPAD